MIMITWPRTRYGETKRVKLPKVVKIKLCVAVDNEALETHGMARAAGEQEYPLTEEEMRHRDRHGHTGPVRGWLDELTLPRSISCTAFC